MQWGIYGRQYFVRNLDTSGAAARLTHINYAFANIDPVNLTCLNGVTRGVRPDPQDPDQGTGAGDADADYARPMSAAQSVDGVADTGWEPLRGNFNQLAKLKAKHPHLKVLISLGGWTYSKYFSDAAATPAAREKFARSCIDMYIRGNLPAYNAAGGPGSAAGIFDGIDMDWEWPGAEGHAGNHFGPQDKANNTALFAEFRRQLDALTVTTGKRYLLTAFTPADPAKIAAGWDITRNDGNHSVFDYMDFANVQGYDFHGAGSDNSWEPEPHRPPGQPAPGRPGPVPVRIQRRAGDPDVPERRGEPAAADDRLPVLRARLAGRRGGAGRRRRMADGERGRARTVRRGGRHARLQQPAGDGAELHGAPRHAVGLDVLLHRPRRPVVDVRRRRGRSGRRRRGSSSATCSAG